VPRKLLAYLQLTRLPNVFTALADVMMGFLVTRTDFDLFAAAPRDYVLPGLLVAASCCLYTAGIVLNDVFDFQIDRQERPARPIPSGRVPMTTAKMLGSGLLLLGIALGFVVSQLSTDIRPALVATVLAAAVLIYDSFLKRTPFGPLGMGLCRQFNVLLGMSVSVAAWSEWNYLIAGGIAIYIIGVTWFARTEADTSNRLQLSLAILFSGIGILMLALFPRYAPADGVVPLLQLEPGRWNLLWIALAALIGWRCIWAVIEPHPLYVQAAVRQCIFSLVMLDAVVCFAVRGTGHAVAIMLLMVPMLFLGRWVYST
jgi:4-hydroxybenzoate polyprenyltransferase